MSAYPYEYYIDIVTKRYFDGVDNYRLQQVLDCFHEDAVLTVLGRGYPERRERGVAL